MSIFLSISEYQFLSNTLIERFTNAVYRDTEGAIIQSILYNMKGLSNIAFSIQEIGYLQSLLQELSEIHGSRHSIANEKKFMGPGTTFIPQRTLILVKSISDKLGANLVIDTTTQSDAPQGGRLEGSIWVMTDPTIK